MFKIKCMAIFVLLFISSCSKPPEIPMSEKELYAASHQNIQRFYDFCLRRRYNVNLKDIIEILYACKIIVPVLSGERYEPIDVLSIIMQESRFDKTAVGQSKEIGLCQILKPNLYLHILGETDISRTFDIQVNIKMSCIVLNMKYHYWKNYDEMIIAYNSIGNTVYLKNIKKNKKVLQKFFSNTLEELGEKNGNKNKTVGSNNNK